MVAPITAFAMNSALLGNNFRFRPSQPESETKSVKFLFAKKTTQSHKDLKSKIVYDFGSLHKIVVMSTIRYFCSRQTKYKKWLQKVKSVMQKELDLSKFIHFTRLTRTAMLALLNGRQKKFVDRFS